MKNTNLFEHFMRLVKKDLSRRLYKEKTKRCKETVVNIWQAKVACV